MPPKKKKKKGKKKGKKDDDDAPEEKIMILESRVSSLQQQLIMQETRTAAAEGASRDLQEKLLELQQVNSKEKERTFSIAEDMTSQYKAMRDGFQKTVVELQDEITASHDKLKECESKRESERKNYLNELQKKDAKIAEVKKTMDDMADSFADMLRSTLDQMSQKISIPVPWEGEGVPRNMPTIGRGLQELNMGVSKPN